MSNKAARARQRGLGNSARQGLWARILIASLSFAMLLCAAAPGFAGDAQALFAEGERAFAAQEYEKAAQAFEAANRESPHVSVLFNAAVSWDHAGDLARAAGAYYAVLALEGVTPEQAQEAESRLDALSRMLGFVQVSKPVGGVVSVGHVEEQSVPAYFFLAPGSYEVELRTGLGQTKTPVRVRAGERLQLVLNEVEAGPRTAAPPAKEPSASPPAEGLDEEDETPQSTQEVVGWVTLGVGVLASGAAVYLGLSALSARDRFNSSGQTNAQARSDAESLRTATNLAWGGAGLLGVGGTVLLLTAPTVEF